MTPIMLRQLWALIERTQSHILLTMDDASLAQWVVKHLRAERSLDHHEVDAVSNYIHSRITLIRDMAQARSA
jgi:hypothetical protein